MIVAFHACFTSAGSNQVLHGSNSSIQDKATLARMIHEKCKEPELYKYYMTNGVRYVAGASLWK
jgi:hypothetical protein